MKNTCCFTLTFLMSAFTIAQTVMVYTPVFNSIVPVASVAFKILEVTILIKYIAALIISTPERHALKQICYGFLTADILGYTLVKNTDFHAGLLLSVLLVQLAVIAVHFEIERQKKIKYTGVMKNIPAKLVSGRSLYKIALPDSIRSIWIKSAP